LLINNNFVKIYPENAMGPRVARTATASVSEGFYGSPFFPRILLLVFPKKTWFVTKNYLSLSLIPH